MVKHTVQQILQQHGTRLIQTTGLPLHYLKALEKLSTCRTAVLGGHAQYCDNNHLNGIWYNSCKHRSCPQCQGMPTEQWLINTKNILLNCPHHHVIFTMPSELNTLWRYNQNIMTNILFKATQETLQQFSSDKKYLSATPGILSALHTWGRNLSLHPHLHVLISHGGINQQGEWVQPKKESLFPQKPIMMVYRGKLLSMIKSAMEEDRWKQPPHQTKTLTQNLLNKLGRKEWVVHFCKRYDYAEGVAKYLSRYVKSGPLRNQQITSVSNEKITYKYKSHQTKKTERLTLNIEDFIKRLLQHIPLRGKPTVRYCGLYHSAARKKLNQARRAFGQAPVSERQILQWQNYLETKDQLPTCEVCGLTLTKAVNIAPIRNLA